MMSQKLLGRESGIGIKTIYCDGGCHNTGERKGIGAWAYVDNTADTAITIIDSNGNEIIHPIVKVHAMFVNNTTNNRTEMLAVINAIKSSSVGTHIDIISDSGYVVKGFNHPDYLDKWLKSNWKNSKNEDVANQDLWHEILNLSYRYGVKFGLIKGHYKDPNPIHAHWNAIVDQACTWIMNNHCIPDEEVIMEFDTYDRKFITAYPKCRLLEFSQLDIKLRGKIRRD